MITKQPLWNALRTWLCINYTPNAAEIWRVTAERWPKLMYKARLSTLIGVLQYSWSLIAPINGKPAYFIACLALRPRSCRVTRSSVNETRTSHDIRWVRGRWVITTLPKISQNPSVDEKCDTWMPSINLGHLELVFHQIAWSWLAWDNLFTKCRICQIEPQVANWCLIIDGLISTRSF